MIFNPFEVEVDLVIWDFDGTILQTEWPAYVSASREFERVGETIDLDVWQATLGSAQAEPWWEALKQKVGGFGETDDEFLARYRAYKNELTDANDVLPGVRELMVIYDKRGVKRAIASSSPRYWLDRHLPRLGLAETTPVVVSRDDVGADRTKPHPDLFLLAAERSGVDPTRCLVIEDTNHGIVAAKTAGMHAIAVPHELTKMQDFSLADRVVSSIEELITDTFGVRP